MAKISSPRLFSTVFGISPSQLDAVGVLDPTLNIDTPLFIDPRLLPKSAHEEMNTGADQHYRQYFEQIVELLSESQVKGDTYWRNAAQRLRFPEIKWTCLGYGADSIDGSGIGPRQRERLTQTASDIIRLGIRSPDLFSIMALLESGIGADRIGDMTTNVIFDDLIAFNARILPTLGVALEEFRLGNATKVQLPRNPLSKKRTPVLLVPNDVLRDLPMASDWDSVMSAASETEEIRDAINAQIGDIWKERSSKAAKEKLRTFALASQENFRRVLALIEAQHGTPYDQESDPGGVIFWRHLAGALASEFPLWFGFTKLASVNDAIAIVEKVIEQFRFLVEKKGLWTELYDQKTQKPRNERSAQKLFFAVASSYCDANGVDITPEAETGNGPVDFKFSLGKESKVLVEVKLSTNGKLLHGYETQTRIYQESESAPAAYFLVIDIGAVGKKLERLFDRRNAMALEGQTNLPKIELIDGLSKKSASLR